MVLFRSHYFRVVCVVVALLGIALAINRGWWTDKNFYTVIQQDPSGKIIDGWVVQGAPSVRDGIYVFTNYRTEVEMRISVQGTVVTKVGPDMKTAFNKISWANRSGDADGLRRRRYFSDF